MTPLTPMSLTYGQPESTPLPGPQFGNPFATRYVRPGRIAFLFPTSTSARQWIDQLARHAWWGQIVGPHGVGKSTLLHSLVPHLKAAGRHIVWITLRAGQRQIPASVRRTMRVGTPKDLVLVDGYEQLGWWPRRQLKRHCRRRGAGLLVTTHRRAGFPTSIELLGSLETVQQLTRHLLRNHGDVIDAAEVSHCYQQAEGNVRETLFALYDLYEQRRPTR
jgi:hypothetical protein